MKFFFSRLRRRNPNPNNNPLQIPVPDEREHHGGVVGGLRNAQLLVEEEEEEDDDDDEDDFRTAATSSDLSIDGDDDDEISSTRERYADQLKTSSSSSSSLKRRMVQNDENSMALINEAASSSSAMAVTSLPVTDGKRNTDAPPSDDCCPICFGVFVVPCRAPCGHWYCGGCILQYWNYGAALQPCNCPMCSRKITNLTPEASLIMQQEVEVTEVLRNVQKYNRLFVGGLYGFILKVLETPLYIKRMFQDMMNPDRPGAHLNKLRILAMVMGLLYTISPFDFLRIGRQNVIDVFDYSAMALSFILYLVGLYVRRRRFQRVREMAAVQL